MNTKPSEDSDRAFDMFDSIVGRSSTNVTLFECYTF